MFFTHSASRKATLVFALAAFLYPVSANGQSCGDTNCPRFFRPFRSSGSCAEAAPANAAAPAKDEPAAAAPAKETPDDEGAAAAAAAPTMFAAPAPTGEIAGGRSSIALPSFRLSLPKISLETPELCLHGFTRFRRDPQMMIDGAAAPASHHNPLLFGQLTGASAQQTQPRRSAAAAPAAPAPAAAAPAAAAPAEGCTSDGCTSLETQRIQDLTRQVLELQKLACQSSADPNARTRVTPVSLSQAGAPMVPAKTDPWQNSAEFELKACEQQVAGLESQILELQQLVEKLAKQGVSASPTVPKSSASHGQPSNAVDPWSREQQETDEAAQQSTIAAQQAERIALLEARLEQFEKMNSASRVAVAEEVDIAEPLIKSEQQQTRKPTTETRSKTRTSVLDKLGMSLSRR